MAAVSRGSRLKEPEVAQASLKTVKACQEKIVKKTEEIDALRKKMDKLLQKNPKWENYALLKYIYGEVQKYMNTLKRKSCRFNSQNHSRVVVAAAEKLKLRTDVSREMVKN